MRITVEGRPRPVKGLPTLSGAHDGLYLALAARNGCRVVTSDQRLHRACQGGTLAQVVSWMETPRHGRQFERLRGLFVVPFAVRLLRDLEVGKGGAAPFRTSSTTSCHQCSAGALSSPSSRRRVSANVGSWCHPSQSAWVFHVPTITRLSSLSAGRRSCPPIQPGRFLAADKRLRMTASQSRPASGLRCTCVTIVFIGRPSCPGSESLSASLYYFIRPREHRRWDGEAERLRGLEVDDQLQPRGHLHREIADLGRLSGSCRHTRPGAATVARRGSFPLPRGSARSARCGRRTGISCRSRRGAAACR
jgi:hypothetical protein